MPAKTAQKSPRIDAWYSGLDEPTRWKAYDKACRSKWYVFAAWAKTEYGLKREPGRQAVYNFRAYMRENESAHRVEETITAKREVRSMAQAAGIDNQDLITAYTTMGADLAMRTGVADDAKKFTGMAIDLASIQFKQIDLDLKRRAQETKEEALKLARDKFEFDAAKKAIEKTSRIKEIMADGSLDDDAKILAVRQELFGEVPQ
jgi:hypothetical protein